MNRPIQFKATASQFKNSIIFIALALACFALSPIARAVSPAPDGGYANRNTAEGNDALFSLTTGTDNTALGFDALYSNTTGGANTATGANALYFNTTGSGNTATGADALISNTTGYFNTATGTDALASNTTGYENTANGLDALLLNTTGFENTATGFQALFSNTEGFWNTAAGARALYSNTTGISNTATGFQALQTATTGVGNTANGANALQYTTTGANDTATGASALQSNTTGSANTADGLQALYGNTTGYNNTASGTQALYNNTTGSSNIALGNSAGSNLTTGSNNIAIGNDGLAGESNTTRIGTTGIQTTTFMAGIYGATVAKGIGVVVDSTGKLGTKGSAERFKTEIKPMDRASEAILALKPVSFRYKKELDPEAIPQFGLIAEDVAKVNPDMVVRDNDGKIYTVRYDAVNAMLLNEFLKEHQKVQKLEAALGAVNERLKEQDAKIDKVNAKVELTKPSPKVVENQ